MALTARLRSVLNDARERAGRADDSDDAPRPGGAGSADRAESRDVPETSLYECVTCDTVYVAEEKSTCSTCGNDVEEVSATLSRE
ncbi:hypothetical protein [Halosimplex amylolyticum]|uniref:hypothetical protein n=1 Tax=Halosimplex amylolyticum TaxID=3396616 RepID=UPI003F546F82